MPAPESPPPVSVSPGVYRHFKGGRYQVLGLARHSETEEWLVIYRPLADAPAGHWWVRPLAMFTEAVPHQGLSVPRFAPEPDATSP